MGNINIENDSKRFPQFFINHIHICLLHDRSHCLSLSLTNPHSISNEPLHRCLRRHILSVHTQTHEKSSLNFTKSTCSKTADLQRLGVLYFLSIRESFGIFRICCSPFLLPDFFTTFFSLIYSIFFPFHQLLSQFSLSMCISSMC